MWTVTILTQMCTLDFSKFCILQSGSLCFLFLCKLGPLYLLINFYSNVHCVSHLNEATVLVGGPACCQSPLGLQVLSLQKEGKCTELDKLWLSCYVYIWETHLYPEQLTFYFNFYNWAIKAEGPCWTRNWTHNFPVTSPTH